MSRWSSSRSGCEPRATCCHRPFAPSRRPDDVALQVPERFAVAVAAIREGYLLHYGDGRLLAVEDDDAALLAGDRLYALGLAELAEIGDLPAVRAMADVIDRCGVAHAAGDTAAARRAWEIGTRALGADR